MLEDGADEADHLLTDFVVRGLASTEPFMGLGHVSHYPDRRLMVSNTYKGKTWILEICVDWQPVSRGYVNLYVSLRPHTDRIGKVDPIEAKSLLTFFDKDIGRVSDAMLDLWEKLKLIADAEESQGYTPGGKRISQAKTAVELSIREYEDAVWDIVR